MPFKIAVQANMSEELVHCHVTLLNMPSTSVRLAIISVPTLGCSVDRVTSPASFTLVTVTVTSCVSMLFPSSAVTVTMYMLSPPMSIGIS